MSDFLFVTDDVVFQESTPKGAVLEITMLPLNKVSQQGTEYRMVEGDAIAASLVGNPIYYGINPKGKHNRKRKAVGEVLTALKIGDKIKGTVLIWAKNLVDKIKNKFKFLFSVGGNANFAESIKKGGRWIKRMVGAVCNHLQILDAGTNVGFPDAKMEKVIEINETVPFKSSFYIIDDYDPIETLINDEIISDIGIELVDVFN